MRGQHLAQAVKLNHRGDAGTQVGPAPCGVGQPARVEIGVDGHILAKSLGRLEQRFQFHLLDGPLTDLTALHRLYGLEDLVGLKWRERLRDLGLLPDEGEPRRVVHDLEILPEVADDALDSRTALRQGERAHDLGKVRIGSGSDEESTRKVAVFVRIDSEPRPGAATRAERVLIELRRFVEGPPSTAFAAHEEIGQIAGRADLVEPELAPATLLALVDESGPVEVVHVSPRTGAHEAGGHHGEAIEASPLVQRLAVNEAPRALGPVFASGFLNDEPFREPPRPDAD